MSREIKTPPAYVVTSVDHALRIAVMLQMEGALTVSEVADRLGVARSTAHRLLTTLVFRDFAEQDDRRRYRPGRVLALARHSRVETSRLRSTALPTMRELVDDLGETVNLTVRVGASVRFAASVECTAALRVTSREGMAFPAHLTSGGLVLLAALDPITVHELFTADVSDPEELAERPDPSRLQTELAKVRRAGFALNSERSERGIVAVGVPVRGAAVQGAAVSTGKGPVAGLAVAMPSVRYDRRRLPWLVEHLRRAATDIATRLAVGTDASM